MKIIFITGNHPRHAYFARTLARTGYLAALIIEQREIFIPEPAADLNDDIKDLFIHHFQTREETELKGFGKAIFPKVPTIKISSEQLNSQEVQQLIKSFDPELLLTYGCHILLADTLSCATGEKWNCHGGLSPWYKGAITHFWPSYMLEPQMTGMTVHDLSDNLDAGDVVHQCCATLERGDKLHDLAVKAVKSLAADLPQLLNKLKSKQKIVKKAHTTTGMLWLSSRWRPEHLELIYKHYNDNIVDHYLNGKFQQKSPVLHRQF